jgi:rubrerythrin
MISKKDAEKYLEEMKKMEIKMHEIYGRLSKEVKDSFLQPLILRMSKEELGHANHVEKLMDIVSKWKE